MRHWTIVLFLLFLPAVASANTEDAAPKPCGAIALIEAIFEVIQTEDVKQAEYKFAAVEAWYKNCESQLLKPDRERLQTEIVAAKRSLVWPRTVEAAADELISKLSASDLSKLKSEKKSGLIGYHFGLGMSIRNGMGLWHGNTALRLSACGGEYCHPDDASMKIIEAAWQKLQIVPKPSSK